MLYNISFNKKFEIFGICDKRTLRLALGQEWTYIVFCAEKRNRGQNLTLNGLGNSGAE